MNPINIRHIFLLVLLIPCFLFSQPGNYYDSLSTSSPDFINRLKARIRSPYTKISYDLYDETNVTNFSSRDTSAAKRVVTCVYSGENYVYTPPFTWGYYSREHTWCHSWMPTYNSETGDEYSDQHHLFPTNQDRANGVRSNHPLGIVKNLSSSFGSAKYGTDSAEHVVYEPRNSHKGDAARALLYMSVKYDGVNGSWNFNWLNNVRLPSVNEGPEDLNTLLLWNKMDPPDKWEVDRNNYIQSIQQNRNPFVDHPEYVNFINFNDLTIKSPLYAAEPVNQVTGLKTIVSDSSVTISWTDALPDKQAPSGYILLAYSKDNYFIPVDGTEYNNDADLSDGYACLNIPYQVVDSYTFNNLKTATDYYFTLYSFNGPGSEINYKTTGIIPRVSGKTTGFLPTAVCFNTARASVAGNSGNYNIPLVISNPSLTNSTAVQVFLTSGSSGLIAGFTDKTVTFPANSSDTQYVSITIADDSLAASGTQELSFGLKNITGGNSAVIISPETFILSVLDPGRVTGGGNETFSGFPETGTAYKNGSFKGNDGSTWTYVLCSGNSAAQITSPSPVFKKDPAAAVSSGILSGGCSGLSFKYMQSFSSNVNLGVYINDSLITTVTSNGEPNVIKSSGPINANFKGTFTLKFAQINSSSGQVTIDNIVWTGNNISDVSSRPNTIAKNTMLEQSYPNPCNPEAIIAYDIPEDCIVSLKVYNLLGMEAANLVNEPQTAGRHEVRFNGNNLASGIYLYKLTAGSESVIKKLLLVK